MVPCIKQIVYFITFSIYLGVEIPYVSCQAAYANVVNETCHFFLGLHAFNWHLVVALLQFFIKASKLEPG